MEKRGDGELELAGVRVGSSSVLGVWGGELARKRGERDVALPLVLKRMREGEPGLFPELAMAAVMWQLWSTTGVAWRGKRGSSTGGVGPGGCGGAACGSGAAGRGLPAFLSGGGATLRRRQRQPREREEEDDSWTCLQFQKNLGVLL